VGNCEHVRVCDNCGDSRCEGCCDSCSICGNSFCRDNPACTETEERDGETRCGRCWEWILPDGRNRR
jgi:hypothetical protein